MTASNRADHITAASLPYRHAMRRKYRRSYADPLRSSHTRDSSTCGQKAFSTAYVKDARPAWREHLEDIGEAGPSLDACLVLALRVHAWRRAAPRGEVAMLIASSLLARRRLIAGLVAEPNSLIERL